MNKIILVAFSMIIIGSCSDPNTLGINVHPPSDNIIIGSTSSSSWQDSQTESEDSLRTDNALNLILGEINDPVFGVNTGGFYTQILLTENNTDLGNNPIVDSVILSYSYSGLYGDLNTGFTNLEVTQIYEDIYKDSIYYNNAFNIGIGNIDNVNNFNISDNAEDPILRINLNNDFGQQILNLGNDLLKDNETFLAEFKGISVLALAENTMLYLNPDDSDSYFKIYYHNDESDTDTLSLDFELGGDATRFNLFNEKNENSIIEDDTRIYIQSMAGYKIKISINNMDSIKSLLDRKVINKVTVSFDIENNSQNEYEAHERLVLVRVNDQGDNVFLTDFINGGEAYFGGSLEDEKYEFNITQYFFKMLNNELYTKDLYLLPAGAVVNANRTILKKQITLNINYSEL